MNINPISQPAAETPRPAAVRSPATTPAPAADAADAHAPAAEAQALKQAVAAANDAMQKMNSELDFSVDGDTGKTVVRVIDKQTGEVIRQMPSKELLEIAKSLDRLQGLLVRNSA